MQQMKNLYLAFTITAVGMGLAMLNLYPDWIPEARWIGNGIAIGASLVAAGGIGWMVWLIRAGVAKEGKPLRSIVPTVVLALVLGCGLVFMVLVQAYFLSGGIFPAYFHGKMEFPEHQVTLYVYDDSFLDGRTLLRVRRGWLPFMENVEEFNMGPSDFNLEQDGEWVSFPGGRYHLPTGDLETAPLDSMDIDPV